MTLQGFQPGPYEKPNQDSLLVVEDMATVVPSNKELPEGEYAFFGVFDGHGPQGEQASVRARRGRVGAFRRAPPRSRGALTARIRLAQAFCRAQMPTALASQPNFPGRLLPAYRRAFLDVHQRFVDHDANLTGIDASVSGTTAVTALFHGKSIMVANLGTQRRV